MRNGRAWLLGLIAVLIEPAKAPLIKQWQLEETATAPVLAVCQVDEVAKGGLVPAGVLKWQVPTDYAFTELGCPQSVPAGQQHLPQTGRSHGPSHEEIAQRAHQL